MGITVSCFPINGGPFVGLNWECLIFRNEIFLPFRYFRKNSTIYTVTRCAIIDCKN